MSLKYQIVGGIDQMKPDNQRVLPALLRSVDFAQESGWITDADLAGQALMFTYAGLIDSSDPNNPMLVKWGAELTKLMDKYGLTLFGRNDKPSVVDEVSPIDIIKANRITHSENIDLSNDKPN
jgi:hypothetical protein